MPSYSISVGEWLFQDESAYDPVEVPQEEEKKELPPWVEEKAK